MADSNFPDVSLPENKLEVCLSCPGKNYLDEDEKFVFRSGVLVNGRSAKFIGGLDAPIHDGDEVLLMRPSLGAM